MAAFPENNVSNRLINGTTGDDQVTFTGQGTADTVVGFDGNDTISATGATYTNMSISGGTGADTISDFGSDSIIYGNQGGDLLTFNAPNTGSTVYGGQGNDLVQVSQGSNFLIYGNIGNDVIDLGFNGSGVGGSTVYGGQGSDSITGSGGTDYINGGQGTDTIVGGIGSSSTLIGGDSSDVISAQGAAAMIYGNLGDDQLSSTGAQTSIYGGQGSDTITLTGTAGNGGAATGAMNALVYGNLGDDTINVTSANTSTVYGGQGADTINVTGSATTATDDGTTVGEAGVNNVLFGNAGDDVITVGFQRSTVDGGSGLDIITGNNQNDVFTGGADSDSFNITGATVTAGGGGASAKALEITDFVSGTDHITLGGGAATSANFSVAQVNGGLDAAINQAQGSAPGQYTFVAGTDNGYIFYNNNGTLTGATLDGANSISSFSTKDIAG